MSAPHADPIVRTPAEETASEVAMLATSACGYACTHCPPLDLSDRDRLVRVIAVALTDPHQQACDALDHHRQTAERVADALTLTIADRDRTRAAARADAMLEAACTTLNARDRADIPGTTGFEAVMAMQVLAATFRRRAVVACPPTVAQHDAREAHQ